MAKKKTPRRAVNYERIESSGASPRGRSSDAQLLEAAEKARAVGLDPADILGTAAAAEAAFVEAIGGPVFKAVPSDAEFDGRLRQGELQRRAETQSRLARLLSDNLGLLDAPSCRRLIRELEQLHSLTGSAASGHALRSIGDAVARRRRGAPDKPFLALFADSKRYQRYMECLGALQEVKRVIPKYAGAELSRQCLESLAFSQEYPFLVGELEVYAGRVLRTMSPSDRAALWIYEREVEVRPGLANVQALDRARAEIDRCKKSWEKLLAGLPQAGKVKDHWRKQRSRWRSGK